MSLLGANESVAAERPDEVRAGGPPTRRRGKETGSGVPARREWSRRIGERTRF